LYLKRLFDSQKTNQNKLDEQGLDRIFATTENGNPWKVKQETVYENGITYEIWIGLWQKFFSLDPEEAFRQLIYIGYCGRFIDTVHIFKYRQRDLLKSQSKRKAFNLYVIGHHSFVRFPLIDISN
jgi:hypothetical protein